MGGDCLIAIQQEEENTPTLQLPGTWHPDGNAAGLFEVNQLAFQGKNRNKKTDFYLFIYFL